MGTAIFLIILAIIILLIIIIGSLYYTRKKYNENKNFNKTYNTYNTSPAKKAKMAIGCETYLPFNFSRVFYEGYLLKEGRNRKIFPYQVYYIIFRKDIVLYLQILLYLKYMKQCYHHILEIHI